MYIKLVYHEFESRAEGVRAALHSCPSRAILKRGAAASFAYRSPGAPAAMIIAAGRQSPMEKGADGGETYGVAVAWTAR